MPTGPRPTAPSVALTDGLERWLLDRLMPPGPEPLESRLFRGLALFGGAAAFLVILPLNYFQRLFPIVNFLVVLLGLASFAFYAMARRGHPLPGPYFLVLIGLLDLIWFGNAGSEGSISMFFISASVYLVVFFRGPRRWLALLLFLANGMGLYLAERRWPNLVTRFPDADSRFVDLLGSFVVCSLVVIFVLWVVLDGYHRERAHQALAHGALQASESRFRALLEQSPISMVLLAPTGTVLEVNQAFTRTLGYTREQLPHIEAWWPQAYPDPDYRNQVQEAWQQALQLSLSSRQPVPPMEFTVCGLDGCRRSMEIQAAHIAGNWLVMFTDLTARRSAESALQEREAQLLQTQEAGQVGTFTWDIPTDHWVSSPVLDRILGLPADFQYTLASWNALVHPDFQAPMQHYVLGILREHRAFDQEYPVVRPLDGREIWVHGRADIDYAADGTPLRMIGTIQDISEAKQAEEARRVLEAQVLRAHKMESLGSLAGGVAHDMNNVLGAILALSSAHQAKQPEGSSAWQAMETIGKACLRGRSLVQGLLNFTRQELSETRLLDLNGLVQDEIRLLEHTTLGRVQLETRLEAGLPPIEGDPAALSHALMNLCVNSLDAMPSGGLLQLSTRRLEAGFVEVEVADSGLGMAPEVLARAVDPYFTTKPQGKGTGLGLALVYSTVKAHGGSLHLSSQPGQGTVVCLRFPATLPPSAPDPLEPAAPQAAPSRARRILMVDDDPMIREALGELLDTLGHQTQAVESGTDALHWLDQGEALDGVILDLNMPGMDGAETLQRLRQRCPDLPVLLATGRPDQVALDLMTTHPRVALLAKPFSLNELREALERWP